eukprot:COSAG06_NODE_304_length_17855_cov_47.399414_17_plen_141_part_00
MAVYLQAAVAAGHALNYLRLASLDQAMNGAPGGRGLRWNSQYSGTSLFVSDGPLIHTYSTPAAMTNHNTNEHRVMTLGAGIAYLSRHFIPKSAIVLPRQARDKHRESTQEEINAFFAGGERFVTVRRKLPFHAKMRAVLC